MKITLDADTARAAVAAVAVVRPVPVREVRA